MNWFLTVRHLSMNAAGEVVAQCPAWQAGLFYLDIAGDTGSGPQHVLQEEDAAVYDALVLAVRDYSRPRIVSRVCTWGCRVASIRR